MLWGLCCHWHGIRVDAFYYRHDFFKCNDVFSKDLNDIETAGEFVVCHILSFESTVLYDPIYDAVNEGDLLSGI